MKRAPAKKARARSWETIRFVSARRRSPRSRDRSPMQHPGHRPLQQRGGRQTPGARAARRRRRRPPCTRPHSPPRPRHRGLAAATRGRREHEHQVHVHQAEEHVGPPLQTLPALRAHTALHEAERGHAEHEQEHEQRECHHQSAEHISPNAPPSRGVPAPRPKFCLRFRLTGY